MIERLLQPRLLELATRYPVLTLTGPRQSGKTTLRRLGFERLTEALGERDSPRVLSRTVVYGGDETQRRGRGELLSWRDLGTRSWLTPPPES